MEFTYEEYWKIVDWDNFLISADMDESNKFKRSKSLKFKQFCPNCGNERSFTQRYPKSLCFDCYSLTTDLKGKRVEFFNSEMSGGCQAYYVGTGQKEKYKSETCYIDGIEYFAEEARFGGIAIQLKE